MHMPMQAGAVGVVFGGAEAHHHAIHLLVPYTVPFHPSIASLQLHAIHAQLWADHLTGDAEVAGAGASAEAGATASVPPSPSPSPPFYREFWSPPPTIPPPPPPPPPLVVRTPQLHLGSGQQFWASGYELLPDALLVIAALPNATAAAAAAEGEDEDEDDNEEREEDEVDGSAFSIRLGRATFNPTTLAPLSAPLRVAPAHPSCADAHDCRACHNLTSVFADASMLVGAIGLMPHAEHGYCLVSYYGLRNQVALALALTLTPTLTPTLTRCAREAARAGRCDARQ